MDIDKCPYKYISLHSYQQRSFMENSVFRLVEVLVMFCNSCSLFYCFDF